MTTHPHDIRTRDRDDLPTLMAAGVLAHAGQALLHEAAGHGGVCLAQGHGLLVVAPLWMRCSQTSMLLVAAGPAMNAIAALACLLVLRSWRRIRPEMGLLLWLGFSFNALVFCGYMAVGSATGFGDWPVLFAGVMPSWAWRVPLAAAAALGYYGCLHVAARLFCGGAAAAKDLRRRALVPAAAAAFVACMAEIAGGRIAVMPMLLALGCTIGIGASLTSMDNVVTSEPGCGAIPRSYGMIALGLIVALGFVFLLGRGLALQAN